MVGRYDGEYKDGVAPHAWTGSVAILERYLTDGGRPVEYGQCWVYSGLVVTICRALGKIQTSNVTNEKCFPIVTNTNFEFVVMQVFLADRLLITYLHMIRTEPTLLTNISIATGTKYPMGQMKIAMILAGTSMSGMTYGCSDRTCLRVN